MDFNKALNDQLLTGLECHAKQVLANKESCDHKIVFSFVIFPITKISCLLAT